MIPRDKRNPLIDTIWTSTKVLPTIMVQCTCNKPNVLATIMVLPTAAINRNNPEAIWLTPRSTKYCLNILEEHYAVIAEKHLNRKKKRTMEQSSNNICTLHTN